MLAIYRTDYSTVQYMYSTVQHILKLTVHFALHLQYKYMYIYRTYLDLPSLNYRLPVASVNGVCVCVQYNTRQPSQARQLPLGSLRVQTYQQADLMLPASQYGEICRGDIQRLHTTCSLNLSDVGQSNILLKYVRFRTI